MVLVHFHQRKTWLFPVDRLIIFVITGQGLQPHAHNDVEDIKVRCSLTINTITVITTITTITTPTITTIIVLRTLKSGVLLFVVQIMNEKKKWRTWIVIYSILVLVCWPISLGWKGLGSHLTGSYAPSQKIYLKFIYFLFHRTVTVGQPVGCAR